MFDLRGKSIRLALVGGVLCAFLCLPCPGQTAHQSGRAASSSKCLRLVWDWRKANELSWKQSISRIENLAPAERQRLIVAIARQLRSLAAGLGIGSEEEMRATATQTRIKYVDLNGDGTPEVIAQAGGEKSGCSPTGNCMFWVLYRRGGKYNILLEAEAQTFTVRSSRSINFFDIVLTRHGSAFESEVTVYKFNGSSYGECGCYTAQWARLGDDGEQHRLKEPQITPCDAHSSKE